MSETQLIDTLRTSNEINLYLLEAIPPEALDDKPAAMSGRSVKAIFAHMHSIRLQWLQEIDRAAAGTVAKIPAHTKDELAAITGPLLAAALTASDEALRRGIAARVESGRTGIFKPHLAAFTAYLLAHEAYHRGEICMMLTQNGHKLDDKILYGQWDRWQH